MTDQLNDDTFAYFVAEEVKNKLAPNQRNILLDEKNWGRWQRALIALSENLQNQLTELDGAKQEDERRFEDIGSKRMQKEMRGAYTDRRTRIERFQFHVNKRLNEVTAMIETGVIKATNPWDVVNFSSERFMNIAN